MRDDLRERSMTCSRENRELPLSLMTKRELAFFIILNGLVSRGPAYITHEEMAKNVMAFVDASFIALEERR